MHPQRAPAVEVPGRSSAGFNEILVTTTVDIVGAGVSGLATAWALDRAVGREGVHLRIWERDEEPGGLAGSFATSEFRVEKFYHHLFRRDVALQRLIGELGLGDELIWRPAATGAYHLGRSYRLASPLDLLRFGALSLLDRLRLGALVLRARRVRDWRELDDETAIDWVRRTAGERVLKVVWEPLLLAKFGRHAGDVSAAWLWSKLVDRGGSRDRRGREVLGYLRGGLGRLFERIVEELCERGHEVRFGAPVRALLGDEDGVEAIDTVEGRLATDAVVAAGQVPDVVGLLPPAAGALAERLSRIEFLANVCLVLELRRSLSDFYWTNVTDVEAPFVGIVEHTQWADRDDFSGRHLVYVSAYAPPDDPRLEMSASELLDGYLPHIRRMFPEFDADRDVAACHRWRADCAQPIVRVGYRHLVPDIETPLPNLFLCTMAQIYPHDRQVSNGVEMASATARRLLRRLELEP